MSHIAPYLRTNNMKLLNLNCQRAINPNFPGFFQRTLEAGKHKVLLLQEASDTVVSLIQKHKGKKYRFIRYATPTGGNSELCIVHTRKLRCVDSKFVHVEEFGKYSGILMAAFKSKKMYLSAASVHLPSHIRPRKRLAAMQHVKQAFAEFLKKHPGTNRVVLAGDFNAIFPWEHERNKMILASILLPVRNKGGYTYETHRLEPSDISSGFLHWLGRLGISFRTTLDYVFASHMLVQTKRIRARSQERDVSDHLPIVIDID